MNWHDIGYGNKTLGHLRRVSAEKAIVHPFYDPVSFEHDIGIIFLRDAVQSSELK